MTSNLPIGGKNRSIIAIRFHKEPNQGGSPLQTKVVHSSEGSKREIAPISRVTIVGAPFRRTRSPSIPIKVPSMLVTGGTSSQSMDFNILYVASSTPPTLFLAFYNLQKLGNSSLHSFVAMAYTYASNLINAIKVHVDSNGHLVFIEEEHCKAIEAQDIVEVSRREAEWELEKVQEVDHLSQLVHVIPMVTSGASFVA